MIDYITPKIVAAVILGFPAFVHAALADLTNTVTPDWVGSATQISAFGLVAWIVYYMFSKWLPAIQAAHAEELAEQRKAHAESMGQITKAFTEALQSQRSDLLSLHDRTP